MGRPGQSLWNPWPDTTRTATSRQRWPPKIPTLENGGFSQDLMSITWKLKEGLKWSDGSDMTAGDVVFTWLYCIDDDTGCTSAGAFADIASVQALDALTVKITFDAPHVLSVHRLRRLWNAGHQPGAVCGLCRRGCLNL